MGRREEGVCVIRPEGEAMEASCGGWSAWLLLDNRMEKQKVPLKKAASNLLDNRLESPKQMPKKWRQIFISDFFPREGIPKGKLLGIMFLSVWCS